MLSTQGIGWVIMSQQRRHIIFSIVVPQLCIYEFIYEFTAAIRDIIAGHLVFFTEALFTEAPCIRDWRIILRPLTLQFLLAQRLHIIFFESYSLEPFSLVGFRHLQASDIFI